VSRVISRDHEHTEMRLLTARWVGWLEARRKNKKAQKNTKNGQKRPQ
jgi:hypothetical protein